MQLVYLIDIFEDNFNTVRDRFGNRFSKSKRDEKKGRLFQRNKGNFNIYNLAQSYQKTMEIVTRNINTQNVRKPYWFVTNS